MWKFLEKIYDGDFGGCGLLIAFVILCSTLATIVQAFYGIG
jgi:hypothetical protein